MMILLIRKRNAALIGLFFLCSFLLYSFHVVSNPSEAVSVKQNLQKVIMLDPGHGGEDPGAVSDFSGIKEKDVNLSIALRLKKVLEADNYRVIMTRSEDKLEYNSSTKNIVQKRKEDLLRRKKMMDEGGADIVVSIHLNKFPQGQYFGAQTFYPPNSPESQLLALNVQKFLRELADPNNKREALVKATQPPIIILRDVKTTTVIVECGFLSNAEEEKKFATEAYQEKLALAIKAGIQEYLKKK